MSRRKIRQPGEVVEVRRYSIPGHQRGPYWRLAYVVDVGHGWVDVKSEPGSPFPACRFGPEDVRTPRKRQTTGKVRGRGGKGGWVER